MVYNPRMGQLGSSGPSGSSISDVIRTIRDAVHNHTSPSRVLDTMWRGGPFAPAAGMAGQGDVLNDHKGFFSNLPAGAPAAPPVQPLDDAPQRGVSSFGGPQSMFSPPTFPHTSAPVPSAMQSAAPAPVPAPTAQAAPVPMPQARPAEAPQAQPDTSFFMRNAMSMRDPSTGELIDPSGASSVRGPDLISKMMAYLHNK
jgi:cell division septation protein DedD